MPKPKAPFGNERLGLRAVLGFLVVGLARGLAGRLAGGRARHIEEEVAALEEQSGTGDRDLIDCSSSAGGTAELVLAAATGRKEAELIGGEHHVDVPATGGAAASAGQKQGGSQRGDGCAESYENFAGKARNFAARDHVRPSSCGKLL